MQKKPNINILIFAYKNINISELFKISNINFENLTLNNLLDYKKKTLNRSFRQSTFLSVFEFFEQSNRRQSKLYRSYSTKKA